MQAVLGRSFLYEREIRYMTIAENIVNAYRDSKRSISWDAWLKENPIEGNLLHKAQKLYNG